MIHPLVLLSVVDHYNRVAKDTSRRVVGVLLGEISKRKVGGNENFIRGTVRERQEGSHRLVRGS